MNQYLPIWLICSVFSILLCGLGVMHFDDLTHYEAFWLYGCTTMIQGLSLVAYGLAQSIEIKRLRGAVSLQSANQKETKE